MIARKHFGLMFGLVCWLGAASGLSNLRAEEKDPKVADSPPSTVPGYTIKLDTISSGFDGKTCWVAPRAGIVPGKGPDSSPSVVLGQHDDLQLSQWRRIACQSVLSSRSNGEKALKITIAGSQ